VLSVVLEDVKQLAQKLGCEFETVVDGNDMKPAEAVAKTCDAEMFKHAVGNHAKAD